jgi:aminopeptidase N
MRRFLPVAAVVPLWIAAIAPAAADTYPRQPAIDAVHYVFRLTLLAEDKPDISGEATVTVRFEQPTTELWLDLASPAAEGRGMTVTSVTNVGGPVAFSHAGDRLHLTLSGPTRSGDEHAFTIVYRGIPTSGLRIIPNIHGAFSAFSENWPNRARQWLPMIDHPWDKATGEFIVTTASRYQVVANGLLVEETDVGDGLRRTHWKQSVPIASWLYALGVARFATRHAGLVDGVPLQTWVFPEDRENGRRIFEELSRRTVAFFAERIGPYPYEKLANVQAAGLNGATEHASAIFYGEKGVASGSAPVVHEIAHQWWGNAVTERDWDDVWLSEGFATYFTLLFAEHDEGHDAFAEGLRRSRNTVLQFEQKLPDTPVIHRNLDDMRRVLNPFVYEKGGWVLHMLRKRIGTDAFWRGIRTYYRRYRDRNASTMELCRVMEAEAGDDLSGFFDQWLTRSGVPRVEGSWRYDAPNKRLEITLRQTQTAEPFAMTVEIGLRGKADGTIRLERIDLRDREATATFQVEREPAEIVLDPDVWLLADLGSMIRRR